MGLFHGPRIFLLKQATPPNCHLVPHLYLRSVPGHVQLQNILHAMCLRRAAPQTAGAHMLPTMQQSINDLNSRSEKRSIHNLFGIIVSGHIAPPCV